MTASPSVPPDLAPRALPQGCGSFTLRLGSTGPTVSWQTSDSQSGYRVMRRVGPSTTVVGSPLPAGSTGVVDPTPPGGSACYQLATLGGSAVVATSGLLCAPPSTAPAPGDPAHLSISVDRGGRVALQWDPPTAPGPGFTGYLVVRADQGSVAFPGLVTHSTSDPIIGPSCWYVRAYVGTRVALQTRWSAPRRASPPADLVTGIDRRHRLR